MLLESSFDPRFWPRTLGAQVRSSKVRVEDLTRPIVKGEEAGRCPPPGLVFFYFLGGDGLLSRPPPDGWPSCFEGLPPLLFEEPPGRLPPLFLFPLFRAMS